MDNDIPLLPTIDDDTPYALLPPEQQQQAPTDVGQSYYHQVANGLEEGKRRVEANTPTLHAIYAYYRSNSFSRIVASRLAKLCMALFTVVFAFFLLGDFVHYNVLFGTPKPTTLRAALGWPRYFSVAHVFFIVLVLIWFGYALQLPGKLRTAYRTKRFFYDVLHIQSRAQLRQLEWTDLVSKLQSTERYQWYENLKPLKFAQALLVEDNTLVALFDTDVFKLKGWQKHRLFRHVPNMTRSFLWALRYALFNFVFTSRRSTYSVRYTSIQNDEALARVLRWRFIVSGFVALALSPFLVCFQLLRFVFRYGETLHKRPGNLFTRTWSTAAQWQFRVYNELPHLFAQRLQQAHAPAQAYLKQFDHVRNVSTRRVLAYVAGALLFVMLSAIVWDETVMTVHVVGTYNMLFCSTILAACYTYLAAGLPSSNTSFDPAAHMRNLCNYTHYKTETWQHAPASNVARRQVAQRYVTRIHHFLYEMFGVFTTPIVLWHCARHCDALVSFLRQHMRQVEGLGPVLVEAQFHDDTSMEHSKLDESMALFQRNCPSWERPHTSSSTDEEEVREVVRKPVGGDETEVIVQLSIDDPMDTSTPVPL